MLILVFAKDYIIFESLKIDSNVKSENEPTPTVFKIACYCEMKSQLITNMVPIYPLV